jgi:hypothetical protein
MPDTPIKWKCGQCGLSQWIGEAQQDMLRANNQTFYCLMGHARQFPKGESDTDILRREVVRLKQDQAYLEDMRRQAEERAETEKKRAQGYKGHAAKLAKRAKAGVCPCCNRTFSNMAEHMKTQHADFNGTVE